MKIAVFSKQFPTLSETFVVDQLVGLIERNYDVEIITLNCPRDVSNFDSAYLNKFKSKIVNLSVGIKRVEKIWKFFLSMIQILFEVKKLEDTYKVLFDRYLGLGKKLVLINIIANGKLNKDYDIIIVHFGDYGYFVNKLKELGLLSGKLFVIFHGYEMSVTKVVNNHKKQYKKLFEVIDFCLPISGFWKDKLIEWGCPEKKIKVSHMGVNIKDFISHDRRLHFSKKINLLQVGRLVEKKSIIDSINAVVLACVKYNLNIEFNIIGDGPLFDKAQECIKRHNAKYINLLCARSHNEIKEYMKISDVFLLPSATASNGDMEGIPVAIMEAMVSGCIVVSTRHSGIPELIDDGYNGYLVDEHSPEQIAEKLVYISQLSSIKIHEVITNAQNKVSNEFNNDSLYDELINFII